MQKARQTLWFDEGFLHRPILHAEGKSGMGLRCFIAPFGEFMVAA